MRLGLALLIVLSATAALAQDNAPKPSDTPATPAEASIHAYGDTETTCLEWNDGCRTCRRAGSDVSCSNIGIACQPTKIACTRRVDPPAPANAPNSNPPK